MRKERPITIIFFTNKSHKAKTYNFTAFSFYTIITLFIFLGAFQIYLNFTLYKLVRADERPIKNNNSSFADSSNRNNSVSSLKPRQTVTPKQVATKKADVQIAKAKISTKKAGLAKDAIVKQEKPTPLPKKTAAAENIDKTDKDKKNRNSNNVKRIETPPLPKAISSRVLEIRNVKTKKVSKNGNIRLAFDIRNIDPKRRKQDIYVAIVWSAGGKYYAFPEELSLKGDRPVNIAKAYNYRMRVRINISKTINEKDIKNLQILVYDKNKKLIIKKPVGVI